MHPLSLFFLLVMGASACMALGIGDNGEGNNYTWGAKTATSTLIASETITRRKSLLQTGTRTYTLTQAGTAKTIDYIQITDLKRMRGATAEITSGGVGATTVTIKFTSAKSGAIKSQIEIWGA